MAGVVEFAGVMLYPQAAAIPAAPGDISIQNIGGAIYQVDDQGNASGFGVSISVSAPISGAGTVPSPFTIAAGAVALTKLATQADQTVLGNGSGGAASPVALTISAATGLVATAGTLKNTLTQGVAGGQTVIGGTLTAQNLLLRPNGADATTGQVQLIGVPGSTTAFFSNAGTTGNLPQLVMGKTAAITSSTMLHLEASVNDDFIVAYGKNPNSGAAATMGYQLSTSAIHAIVGRLHGGSYTTSGNITAGTLLINLSGGSGNILYRIAQASGNYIWEANGSVLLTLTNAGVLTLGAAMLVANGTGTVTSGNLAPGSTALVIKEWQLVKGTGAADRWMPLYGP